MSASKSWRTARVRALNPAGEKLRQALRLDSSANVQYRAQLIRLIALLKSADPEGYRQFMGFPDNLPDLRTKRVPRNTKPEGVLDCYFALQERGDLPITY